MAGESARESARRQREKAERLQRSADLWERGADGEQATAAALDVLPKESWTVFHDVRWPGRKYANVDHVAVGPTGVFVIDSKNWSGSITVRDNVLRQNGRSRESTVAGAAEAAIAVVGVTPVVMPEHVQPVLCFVRDDRLTGWTRDVMVCSTANLVEMLTTRTEVLPPHIVSEACLQLDAMLRSATAPAAALPRGRAVAARPSVPRSTSRRKKKRSGPSLVKALVAAVFAVVLIGNPKMVTALSDGIAGLVTSQLTDVQTPATDQNKQHHTKRNHPQTKQGENVSPSPK
ncbi:MAG: hypothetical protein JWR90_3503 [Marmoricola sp.]|nr:hypothetical protein [Marmoricola sp.]